MRDIYDSDRGWHVSKRISLSVIATIAILFAAIVSQAGASVWYVATLESRVKVLEGFKEEIKSVPVDIAAIVATQKSIVGSLEKLNGTMESIISYRLENK